MFTFEDKVLNGIKKCLELCDLGVNGNSATTPANCHNPKQLGVAVSGGADSIALLAALSQLLKTQAEALALFKPELKVITINHNIRQAEETAGDAAYVQKFCQELKQTGFNVNCTLVELAPGEVAALAKDHGQGIEEAARTLRYQAFEKFIEFNNIDFFCLAHHQNDQLETILMRFLSGASLEAGTGIKAVRPVSPESNSFYFRPLLDISRTEIESYLTEKQICWRTDSTNNDKAYYRNKIRLELVPFLNQNFPGWFNSVLTAAERRSQDGDFITAYVEDWWNSENVKVFTEFVEIEKMQFLTLAPSIQYRVLLRACNLLGEKQRIPVSFLQDFLAHPEGKKWFQNIEISLKNNSILVKKHVKTQTETSFSAIIEESGIYQFPFGTVMATAAKSEGFCNLVFNNQTSIANVELPCCIRSFQPDDEIEAADGSMKKVLDIYANWHIPPEQRSFIPLVQKLSGEKQDIVCIVGDIYGFKNWIVYEKVNN